MCCLLPYIVEGEGRWEERGTGCWCHLLPTDSHTGRLELTDLTHSVTDAVQNPCNQHQMPQLVTTIKNPSQNDVHNNYRNWKASVLTWRESCGQQGYDDHGERDAHYPQAQRTLPHTIRPSIVRFVKHSQILRFIIQRGFFRRHAIVHVLFFLRRIHGAPRGQGQGRITVNRFSFFVSVAHTSVQRHARFVQITQSELVG